MEKSKTPLFRGMGTALVTPMKPGQPKGDRYVPEEVDYDAFIRLVRAQLEAGADALIVCGTTGESPCLTDDEKKRLFSLAVREADAAYASGITPVRVPVIGGTGSNNTYRAISLSRLAEEAGCDGLLLVTPYYNKANQAGLIAHFEAVADAVSLPVILYHVPSRTGCRITPETCRVLSRHPRIVGLKEASGDVGFAARVREVCGDGLPLYAGNDDLTLPLLSLGGCGVISVVSNLLPREVKALCRASDHGDAAEALRLQTRLLPLCDVLFADVNPIPVKAAMEMCGLCRGSVRLPLTEADERLKERIRGVLGRYGILS